MAVYLTGDIHGGMDMGGIPAFAEGEGAGLTRDDFLIILGDFGLVWREPPSDREVELLAWFEAQPWSTLFIDGNHENFDLLEALPVERWHGGRVHSVRPHVIHLMRGETFEICGSTFFCVGGAHSIDEKRRGGRGGRSGGLCAHALTTHGQVRPLQGALVGLLGTVGRVDRLARGACRGSVFL